MQGGEHAGSSSKIVQTKNIKMISKPTAGTYRGITKPRFTHSVVSKETSMLDLHLELCRKLIPK
jgi:hypothetical protein